MELRVPEGAKRDFVAGCLIVKDDKLLLLNHSKYGIWLPPGGHVEERETPDETAIRETKEETGLKVELQHSSGTVEEEYIDVPKPLETNLHRVEEGHWHLDHLYKATIKKKEEATHQKEHRGTKWFSMQELESENFDVPKYIRKSGKQAIESLAS